MSDDSTGTTLNVSSVLDVDRGRVRYNHTNVFVLTQKRLYVDVK